LRGVVEHFERWPVQVTFIRGDRLFYVLELDEKSITGSHLLVATGRTPNTEGLGLELASVEER